MNTRMRLAATTTVGTIVFAAAANAGMASDVAGPVDVKAGGPDHASMIGGDDCYGYVSMQRPNHSFIYDPAGYFLEFSVESDIDTTLVVETPGGDVLCNDDYDGPNPGILLASPSPGTFRVWVGSYERDNAGAPAVLNVVAPRDPLGGSNAPAFRLESGFLPDPHVVEVNPGGAYSASLFGGASCPGYVADAPDVAFEYAPAAAGFSLRVYMPDSDIDTVLLVQGPSGDWLCNDDFSDASARAPGILIDAAPAGVYRVWTGTYQADAGGTAPATLAVSEAGFPDSWTGTGGEEAASTGTGFFVSASGHIVTNHHVVDGCAATTVGRLGTGAVDAALVAVDENSDLALLRAETAPEAWAVFRDRPRLRLGETVVVFGFPHGEVLSPGGNLTAGIVSGLSGYRGDLRDFQFTAEIQPGSSGSPVADASGHVIGIAASSLNGESDAAPPQNVNWGVRADIVRAFLDVHNVPYPTAESVDPASIPDIGDALRAVTVAVECRG